ncbi:MAG: DMT family transporter [Dysgonamonadaceae bacterium]|jgi:transporter family protein|nr:DMT family transporter [Dysgonamonadaceae bacterium]
MWLALAFLSAALLGVYDVVKKVSLSKNAVIPVLFLNTLFSSLIFLPVVFISGSHPADFHIHLLLALKAVIVLSSWLFAYFALKHLPITIASPIKATQPILVLLGALLIFQERLNLYQWIGVLFSISSFFLLSKTGKKEGINFRHNKWIFFIVMATITGAISGLYDRYLLRIIDPIVVQGYYCFYQFAMMGILTLFLWYPQRKKSTPFQWRWSIPLISIFLIMADFFYFKSLAYDDALISVVSMVRRSGVIVSFIAGWLFFGEKNLKNKAIDLLLLLIGMYFLYLGSR